MKEPLHTLFTVWVPAEDGLVPEIAPRSAIVSPQERSGEVVTCWFEGNLIGASNLEAFVERCMCAAGRCAYRYSTVALTNLPTKVLRAVATFDLAQGCITEIADPIALGDWLGDEPLPQVGPASRPFFRIA